MYVCMFEHIMERIQKYAVKIDLSAFFEDERQNVIILVDPNWQNVEALQRRVESMFNVENVRFQTIDNYFLPSEEVIEVVKFCEKLKAFIPQSTREKKKRKSKIAKDSQAPELELEVDVDDIEGIATDDGEIRIKRKYGTLQQDHFSCSTPNVAKRSKSLVTATTIEGSNKLTDIDFHFKKPLASTDLWQSESQKANKKKKSTIKTGETGTESESPRISQPGKKSVNNTQKVNKSIQPNKNSAHIFFNDFGEIANGKDGDEEAANAIQPKKVSVHFHCALKDLNMQKARIFRIEKNKNFQCSRKPRIEVQEVIVLKSASTTENLIENKPSDLTSTDDSNINNISQSMKNKMASSIEELSQSVNINDPNLEQTEQSSFMDESSVIAVDDEETNTYTTEDIELQDVSSYSHVVDNNKNEDAVPITPKLLAENEVTIEKMLPYCSHLDGLPDIGDIVIFKMNLDNSNYIAGKCDYTNKRTKAMKLRVIDGLDELDHIPSKYKVNLDDSADNIKYLNIKLSDLLDAKVLKMS